MALAESLGARAMGRVGVYTKTIVRSPVVQFILHARIRHRRLNDVVFVGEDFIQVKQVGKEGHLVQVATKTDFDARIRAATIFDHNEDTKDEDFLVKLEKDAAAFDPDAVPPQCVVLTLDSNDLVFVFLRLHDDGKFRFVQQTCPMPIFDRILFQPGEHLAVDHFSRALAVAANEGEVILYSVKPKDQIQYEIKHRIKDWCPVSAQKSIQVEGVIQHMDFLIPPIDDTDHIILLLVVVEQRRTKAVLIDWHYSSGPRHAQLHPGQALESQHTVSNLLIPLQDAAFLLVTGTEITLWKDILSGSATSFAVQQSIAEPRYPGISAYSPVWASWAKPRRSHAFRSNTDHIYLVREDGLVVFITIPKTSRIRLDQSNAGDFNCHVGTAFASLGDEGDPDILCVAGSASSGKVVSIGNWPTARRIEEMSREATMDMEPIEVLPNWASVTDMISMDAVHTSRTRNQDKDSILVTSGKQPFGTVTEIRAGVEARLSAVLEELDGLHTVTDAWVLADLSLGALLIVLSSPDSTRLLAAGAEFETLDEVGDGSAFETTCRTLAAGTTASGHLVQVTHRTLCASTVLLANFEDTSKHHLAEDSYILAGTIMPKESIIVTAEREGRDYTISCYHISGDDGESVFRPSQRQKVPSEPLSITAVQFREGIMVLTATSDGHVALVYFCEGSKPLCYTRNISIPSAEPAVCDNVTILRSDNQLLAVCGLRDGKVVAIRIDPDSDEILGPGHITDLGLSTVKLVQLLSDAKSAIAMTGASTYLLSWPGGNSASLRFENVWVADKGRPELSQGTITACAQMPSASHLSSPTLADAVMMVSEETLFITSLDHISSTVPRQIPVSSTPNRLVYAEALKQIVCCGLVAEVRKFPSKPQSPPEERRQLWPRLEFIPAKSTRPTFSYDLQPGERVNTLLPWSLRTTGDKTYSYILLGGSYVRTNGKRRGKVTFLQPIIRNWEVSEIRETRTSVYDGEVYSLALYDDKTYIACAGNYVHIERFSIEEGRWDKICQPFKMASPGVHITVEAADDDAKMLVISTSEDSMIALELNDQTDEEGTTKSTLVPVAMGPCADRLISHLVIRSPGQTEHSSTTLFSLASTRYGHLKGITLPVGKGAPQSGHRSGSTHFDAQLPRSLTRMVRNPPPARKGSTPEGIISDRVTGSATDGAVVNFALLDPKLWQRLFWLQRLVEWSDVLSPHSCGGPMYSCGGENMTDVSRALPIGFDADTSVPMNTGNDKLEDLHIDGDILGRALIPDSLGAIKQVLVDLSEKDHAVGQWVRAHLDSEIVAVEDAIDLVRKLDAWF